jgi:long-subunit acyl-CoA synthetase (AMP-forming)
MKDNFLFINGRKKELIITSGGENISPVPIEQQILKLIPECEYAVVIGDQRKFLSMILVPKSFSKIDQQAKTIEEYSSSAKITEYVNGKIDELNSNAKATPHKIQKWFFVENFEVGQELTPTLKLRRHFIHEKYKKKINKLYADEKAQ